jgi:enoyl-CoA hydratase
MQYRDYQQIVVESPSPQIVRIAINRPGSLNALNRTVLKELRLAFSALEPEAQILVITGTGDKAFIAGADISEMAAFTPAEALAFSRQGHELLSTLEHLEQVVIAEVNGYALGGGCELMLACDFAIASDNAKFGQPEVALGVTPGFGGTTRLSRRIGIARARQLLFTGEQITAEEARKMGLVNETVKPSELRARVDWIAERIIKNGPLAVKLAKRSVNVGAETDLASANAFEQHVFAMCFASQDQKEGMKAFLEKRKATWLGR